MYCTMYSIGENEKKKSQHILYIVADCIIYSEMVIPKKDKHYVYVEKERMGEMESNSYCLTNS